MAWVLLLAALAVAPLVVSLGGFASGVYAAKEWVIRLLVCGAATAYAVALARGRAAVRNAPVVWVGLGLVLWTTLAAVLSVAPSTSIVGLQQGEAGLLGVLTYATAGWLTLQLASSWTRVRALMRTVTAASALAAAYGLLQSLPGDLDPIPWERGLLFGAFRSFSTFGNPDMYGAYAVAAFLAACGLLLGERSSAVWRYVAAASVVLIGTSVFTSLTRAAWIGGVIGLCAFAVFMWRLRARPRRFELVVAAVLIASIAGAAVMSVNSDADGDSNVFERAQVVEQGALDVSAQSRFEVWGIGRAAVFQRPVTGWGPDTHRLAFEPNRTLAYSSLVDSTVSPSSAHNWFIQTAVTLGIPGLVLTIALYLWVAWVSGRWLWRTPESQRETRLLFAGAWAACVGYLFAALLVPGSPPAALLLWSLMGVLLAPLAANAQLRQGAMVWVGAVMAAVFALLGVTTIVQIWSDRQAAVAARPDLAPYVRVLAADKASRTNPLNALYDTIRSDAYRALLAVTPVSAGEPMALTKMNAATVDAIAKEPSNPFHRTAHVSGLLVAQGIMGGDYAEQALREADAARELAPNNLDAWYWRARALRAGGRDAEAQVLLEQAVDVRPGFGAAALLLAELYETAGDIEGAVSVLEASAAQKQDDQVSQRIDELRAKLVR